MNLTEQSKNLTEQLERSKSMTPYELEAMKGQQRLQNDLKLKAALQRKVYKELEIGVSYLKNRESEATTVEEYYNKFLKDKN